MLSLVYLILVEAALSCRGAPDVDGRVLGYPTPEVDCPRIRSAADAWSLPVLRLVLVVDVLAAGSVVPSIILLLVPVGAVLLQVPRLIMLLLLSLILIMIVVEPVVAALV